MPPEHAVELANAGLVNVGLHEPPDSWKLTSGSRVGVVRGEAWELRVQPRLEIPRLMFLLAYSVDPSGWRDVVTGFAEEEDLLEAVASGFAYHALRALEPGPLRDYVTFEERSYAFRGRLRIADQMARSPGLPLPLEIAYDEYSLNIRENRILRAAAERLLLFARVPLRARKRLLRVRVLLEDVDPELMRLDALMPPITRLNKRYEPAMVLATLILRGASIRTEAGRVSSTSFIFDMNEVFESFLSVALRESLRRHGGEVRLQYGRENLDRERRIRLKPDITWWRGGQCNVVLDAKYKALVDAKFPNADAYQMLAYCVAFGVSRGFLVYALDVDQRSRRHTVRTHGYVIDVHALNLEAPPDALLEQVDALADDLVSHAMDRPLSLGARG